MKIRSTVLAKIIFITIGIFLNSECKAQHVVGVKSLFFEVWNLQEAPTPDSTIDRSATRKYLNVIPYYEYYFREDIYFVSMLGYEEWNEVSSEFFPSNGNSDDRWVYGDDRSNALRMDVGVGKVIDIDKHFSFKLNATIFFQRELNRSREVTAEYYDENGEYIGLYHSHSKDPLRNNLGFSFTPQINFQIVHGFSVHFDLRYDFYGLFYKDNYFRKIRYEDAIGNTIFSQEIEEFHDYLNLRQNVNYGIGFSYRF